MKSSPPPTFPQSSCAWLSRFNMAAIMQRRMVRNPFFSTPALLSPPGFVRILTPNQLSKEEEAAGEEVEVRREDQDKINKFSRLSSREQVLEDELKAKAVRAPIHLAIRPDPAPCRVPQLTSSCHRHRKRRKRSTM